MGRNIADKEYSAKDYEEFNHRIHDQVDILKKVISKPEFGSDELCIGAELELYLINEHGEVSPVNLQLLEMLKDDQYQSELNTFNLDMKWFTPLLKQFPTE